MPSFNIHLKYGILFGIREYVQKAIDEYIDCPRHHDFYNKFIELKEERRKLEIVKYITKHYYFDSVKFKDSQYYNDISRFGVEGIRAFFLHMVLDKIEGCMRIKSSQMVLTYYLRFCDRYGIFERQLRDVIRFCRGYLASIIMDIRDSFLRRKRVRELLIIPGTIFNEVREVSYSCSN